jgi:hypothetical protein
MMEVEAALMRAHCDNIRRYRKLLETHLTDVERNYIEWRLSEERTALQALRRETNPRPRQILSAAEHDVGPERHQREDGDATADLGKFSISHSAHGLNCPSVGWFRSPLCFLIQAAPFCHASMRTRRSDALVILRDISRILRSMTGCEKLACRLRRWFRRPFLPHRSE